MCTSVCMWVGMESVWLFSVLARSGSESVMRYFSMMTRIKQLFIQLIQMQVRFCFQLKLVIVTEDWTKIRLEGLTILQEYCTTKNSDFLHWQVRNH